MRFFYTERFRQSYADAPVDIQRRSASCLRPDESSALQSFRKQTQPVTIEPQYLDQVTAPTTKNEDLARKRILGKRCLHQSTQPRKSAT
jgi:hypothetical protein